MERAQRVRWIAAAAVIAAAMLPWGCSRAIEEEEPPVLIEHRIEPCRSWCEPMLSECGRAADDRPDGASLGSIETIEQVLLELPTAASWHLTVRRWTGSAWVTLDRTIVRAL
jgi:hypothetical protein